MSRTPTTAWRNRITGSGTLKVAEAKPHDLNFRLHPARQSQALAASLDNVGWVQQVVVNTQTGHLIDGHLRLALAEQRGESELPCLFVDLTEAEEHLVLASLDPIAAMASADRDKLQELLTSIESEDEQVRGLLSRSPARSASSCRWRGVRSTPTRCPPSLRCRLANPATSGS